MTWSATTRALVAVLLAVTLAACDERVAPEAFWMPSEIATIASLSMATLPPLPPSPGNPVADDPRAVDLGHRLFFDRGLSANGAVACASCHRPEHHFKDDVARSRGIGLTARKSMSVVGAAYSPWLFWDGRRDSLWSQALEPLEDPLEHGLTRVDVVRMVAQQSAYRAAYEALFGPLPPMADPARFPSASPMGDAQQRAAWTTMTAADQHAVSAAFANVGRALEAYQRRLQPGPAPFDRFAEALLAGDHARANRHLTADQRAGLRLFIGRGNCVHCHNGPRFSNDEFHNTGLAGDDQGRRAGVQHLLSDPFNCLGALSKATAADCAELRFVKTEGEELEGAFRTVSLRNIADTGPYMHDGRFQTLSDVVMHYNRAPPTAASADLMPLRLTDTQMQQLTQFLHSLSGPMASPAALTQPPRALP